MRLTANCKCGVNLIYETDTKEDRAMKCFRCGEEVKLQNRYSDKNVETILEANVTEEQEIKIARKEKREKRIVRKSFKDVSSGKRGRGRPPKNK